MVAKNELVLGRDVIKEVCDLLNIEYDKELIRSVDIHIAVDDVVTVNKEFYITKKD